MELEAHACLGADGVDLFGFRIAGHLETGHGLAPDIYREGRRSLEPVRAGRYNHLSVRTAAAIILDRLIGEDGEIASLP